MEGDGRYLIHVDWVRRPLPICIPVGSRQMMNRVKAVDRVPIEFRISQSVHGMIPLWSISEREFPFYTSYYSLDLLSILLALFPLNRYDTAYFPSPTPRCRGRSIGGNATSLDADWRDCLRSAYIRRRLTLDPYSYSPGSQPRIGLGYGISL